MESMVPVTGATIRQKVVDLFEPLRGLGQHQGLARVLLDGVGEVLGGEQHELARHALAHRRAEGGLKLLLELGHERHE